MEHFENVDQGELVRIWGALLAAITVAIDEASSDDEATRDSGRARLRATQAPGGLIEQLNEQIRRLVEREEQAPQRRQCD